MTAKYPSIHLTAFVIYLEVSGDYFIYAHEENPSILGFYIIIMEIM